MLNFTEAPPEEDSPDLTDEEIEGAIKTHDSNSFVKALEEIIRPLVRPNVGGTIVKHELRRRSPHLYCRTRIALDGEPDKVILLEIDWLQVLNPG